MKYLDIPETNKPVPHGPGIPLLESPKHFGNLNHRPFTIMKTFMSFGINKFVMHEAGKKVIDSCGAKTKICGNLKMAFTLLKTVYKIPMLFVSLVLQGG